MTKRLHRWKRVRSRENYNELQYDKRLHWWKSEK